MSLRARRLRPIGRQRTEAARGKHRAPQIDEVGELNRLLGSARVIAGLLLFALVVLAVARSWGDVRATIRRISAPELLVSGALVLAGLEASVLTWRIALRELGSTVRVDAASKIYLLGQLGKYIPGSVWALALQMELARHAGVPRSRGMAASIVAIGVNVVTGLALGMLVLPELNAGGAWRFAAMATLLGVCMAALTPPVLSRMVNFGLRLIRSPSVPCDVTWSGILTATVWSVGSWLSYGVSLWILATAVGAPAREALPLCIGAIALAMTLGFLVVIAPSGIGVREAVIVAALAPILERPEALAVALATRLLFTVGDLIAAAVVVPVKLRASQA